MPALALAVSLFVLSQSALLVRLARADALEIGLWRMLIAVPVLLLVSAARGELGEVARVRWRQLIALTLCGLCLFLHWWCWFLAVQQTSLANAMVLFAASPVFTAVGAWAFFGESFGTRHGAALTLCFAGVLLVCRDSLRFEPGHLRGDALGLLSAFLFSAYVLGGKAIRRQLGNLPFTVFTYTTCGILFALALAISGRHAGQFSAGTWLVLTLLALGPTLLGHALFTYCLSFFNVNLMSILVLTEPVLGSAGAYFAVGEPVTAGALLGFLTIVAGVLVLFLPALAKGRARL